jgi:hypothetical protein
MDEKKRALYELCEILSHATVEAVDKLHNAGDKLGAGDLEYVDKLTHALKSIKTTMAMMDQEDEGGYSEEYSGAYRRASGMSNTGRSYFDGNSYARRRDSMGRYSKNGYSYGNSFETMINELRGSMDELPEDKRREVQRFIEKMDRM